jgi:hypothetical protein
MPFFRDLLAIASLIAARAREPFNMLDIEN